MKKHFNIDSLPGNNIDPNGRKIEPVVRGVVKQRVPRKTGIAMDMQNISSSLFESVVLPAIKNIISDFVSNGISMLLWKDDSYHRTSPRSYGGYKDYSTRSVRQRRGREYDSPRRNRVASADNIGLSEIFFTSRADVDAVMASLYEYIRSGYWVTVGDLYSLVGLVPTATQHKYGWSNIDGARVIAVEGGYIIDFPEPTFDVG